MKQTCSTQNVKYLKNSNFFVFHKVLENLSQKVFQIFIAFLLCTFSLQEAESQNWPFPPWNPRPPRPSPPPNPRPRPPRPPRNPGNPPAPRPPERPNPTPKPAPAYQWLIKKAQWSAQDEIKYQEFIAAFGQGVENRVCSTVDRCFKSKANIYNGTDPIRLTINADCADLPYQLRAYFAWKNELPFSIIAGLAPRKEGEFEFKDIRYTPYGNVITSRRDFINTPSRPLIVSSLFHTLIPEIISTASFRVGFDKGINQIDPENPNREFYFNDFYPVSLDRKGITPGTVIYDSNGHVAVVYKITDEGDIYFIDAHPDNSLTMGKFGIRYQRGNPMVGAGFKKFRPLTIANGNVSSDGNITGGNIIGTLDSRLPDFSLEQFFGNESSNNQNWKKANFIFKDRKFGFHEYIKLKLSKNATFLDPIQETKLQVADICRNLKDRVTSVEVAIKNQIDQKPHPDTLPTNIYGADGEWEDYSTPGRDVTLKIQYKHLLEQSVEMVRRWKAKEPTIDYKGSNLPKDIVDTYLKEARACSFSYQNSNGKAIYLDVESARRRIFYFSFDPYHCVERRWGAIDNELRTCRETSDKAEWYSNLQQVRNHTARKLEARFDYTLEEWRNLIPEVGEKWAPDLDLVRAMSK